MEENDFFDSSIEQARIAGFEDENYKNFKDKFIPKLTTDDCFTPPEIYKVVKDWAIKEYGWEGRPIVRPFYPGGDYEHEKYPENCVVIDNPPFSILREIKRKYYENNIDFFLFAPHLQLFFKGDENISHFVITGGDITFENGAKIPISFVSSQGDKIRTAPDLRQQIEDIEMQGKNKKKHPKYKYPDCVVSSSILGLWCKYGVEYRENNVYFIDKLNSQKKEKKVIYGNGFLVPESAAKVAVAQATAAKGSPIIWELSDREKAIVDELNRKAESGK